MCGGTPSSAVVFLITGKMSEKEKVKLWLYTKSLGQLSRQAVSTGSTGGSTGSTGSTGDVSQAIKHWGVIADYLDVDDEGKEKVDRRELFMQTKQKTDTSLLHMNSSLPR